MDNSRKYRNAADLRTEVWRELAPLISGPCVLLDNPNFPNVGDQFIWAGSRAFIESHPDATLAYSSPAVFFDPAFVPENAAILIQGGGNFGDIYEERLAFKEQLVKAYPRNHIVQLPQTVHFENSRRLQETIDCFAGHPRITLCARDLKSYDFLNQYFHAHEIKLVPDMAFCLELKQAETATSDRRPRLLMIRSDAEKQSSFIHEMMPDADIEDWSSLQSTARSQLLLTAVQGFERIVHAGQFAAHRMGMPASWQYPYRIFHRHHRWMQEGIAQLSAYDLVVTDRLHGHIISVLLGIPSVLLDNSYGKNRRFYEAWLQDIPGSEFAADADEAKEAINRLRTAPQ